MLPPHYPHVSPESSPSRKNAPAQAAKVPGHFGGFGHGEPFSVLMHKNQVLSRSFIDIFGYTPNILFVSRNNYERLEKALDLISWFAVGILGTFGLKEAYCRKFTSAMRKEFQLPEPATEAMFEKALLNKPTRLLDKLLKLFTGSGGRSPLQIPFEWLDAAKTTAKNPEYLQHIAKNLGITPQKLDSLLTETPAFVQKVLKGKRNLILMDLLVMAFACQGYFWGKNWLTEKLSGKKGFSGEFKYAQHQYLKAKTDRHEQSKNLRQVLSVVAGFGAALALPFAITGILKTKGASGFLNTLKKTVPYFNYSDGISTGKWVLLWHYIFNYDLTSILASRDKDEAREHITKCAVSDFFYFIGDELISGAGALWLQNRLKGALETPVVQKSAEGFWKWLPQAVPLHEVYNNMGGNTQSLAYRKARANSWVGLIGTTACMLFVVPLLNNWYTHRKVSSEQAALLKPHLPAPEALPLAYRPDFENFMRTVHQQRQNRLAATTVSPFLSA